MAKKLYTEFTRQIVFWHRRRISPPHGSSCAFQRKCPHLLATSNRATSWQHKAASAWQHRSLKPQESRRCSRGCIKFGCGFIGSSPELCPHHLSLRLEPIVQIMSVLAAVLYEQMVGAYANEFLSQLKRTQLRYRGIFSLVGHFWPPPFIIPFRSYLLGRTSPKNGRSAFTVEFPACRLSNRFGSGQDKANIHRATLSYSMKFLISCDPSNCNAGCQ